VNKAIMTTNLELRGTWMQKRTVAVAFAQLQGDPLKKLNVQD